MVRPSVAKNRATPEHDFSEKLENFQQRKHDIILNYMNVKGIKHKASENYREQNKMLWGMDFDGSLLTVQESRCLQIARNLTTTLLDALAHATLEIGIHCLANLMDRLRTSILDKTGLIERAWRFTSVNIASECLFEKGDLEFGSS